MSITWNGPVVVRGLTALWILIGAWLGARVVAEARTLSLPVAVPSMQPAPALEDPWLARHWSVNQQGDLPLTRLPLQWLGTIRSLPIDGSVVVLGYQKRQYTLTIGQTITPGLTLTGIDEQGLVLDNQGRLERLRWPAAKPIAGLTEVGAAPVTAQASPRERVDLSALLQRIQAAPVLNDGRVVGYQLQPGQAPELFTRLGLEPGDVLRRVDKVSVADTAALMQQMPHWREADSLILELERQGRALSLAVELSL